MASLNKVFLMGNLTRDPELRYTAGGTAVADIGLAVNQRFTSRTGGEQKEDTLFVTVTVWAKQAEACGEYLYKGAALFVEGRLQLDTWESKDGQKRSRIHVVAQRVQFIGKPKGGRDTAVPGRGAVQEPAADPFIENMENAGDIGAVPADSDSGNAPF